MKKFIVLLIVSVLYPSICMFAQNDALYDVNYDALEFVQTYDTNNKYFQEIFLQYEAAITTLTEKVRQKEKASYQAEMAQIRQNALLKYEKDIAQAREDIYRQEIQNVREQETERLTDEITRRLTQELNIRIAAEYEEKKNAEIAVLKKELRNQIYVETNAGTARVKFITFSVTIAVCVALAIVLIIWCIKRIAKSLSERERFKNLIETYMFKLKNRDGASEPLFKDIEKDFVDNQEEKQFHEKALNAAIKQYSNTKELDDYENKFITIKNLLSSYIKNWKEDNTRQILDALENEKTNLETAGAELFHSLALRTEGEKNVAKGLFQPMVPVIKDVSSKIENKDLGKEFRKSQKQLSKSFADLAKKFKEERF